MLERNCMAKTKINLQNPVWLSLGALFLLRAVGKCIPMCKNSISTVQNFGYG